MTNIFRSEIHIIHKNHRLYKYCDDLCYKSKNLYNHANYLKRQAFINNEKIPHAFDINKKLKTHDLFKALPARTSQQIIIKLEHNWKSFFNGIKAYKKDSSRFCGRPKLPKYKELNGRNLVQFDYMQTKFENGMMYFQNRKEDKDLKREYIETNVTKESFRVLQIIPCGNCYKISIIYRKGNVDVKENNGKYMAIDLGLNNLATCVNNLGHQPIVINGRIIKSENQYYNKKYAKLRRNSNNTSSNKMKKLTLKRGNIINTHMHRISRIIVNYCKIYDIRTIIIGNNKDWKRSSKMSKMVNQSFIQIPHELLIHMISYKAEECGISVVLVDEKYTSKSSFIDNDILPDKFGDYEFSGKRKKRGLYQSKDGTLINADVNGAYNILRKSNPEFKYDRIQGVSLHPVILNI